ncbi:hypothetical protein L1987_47237 [Smallanthus sonchifolius]|uniref:Uncharacterized protein n=1 Tax=Smallanthus sonchifolius TaxID=185202 RepID=A0ACB9G1T6_9ASTR|nr:hypothetical protein L1987_47237 [Smallanthus sonchifolius]
MVLHVFNGSFHESLARVNTEKDLNEAVMKKDSKIIQHPCYQSNGKCLLSWFDVRVFYVKVNNFMVDGYTPEYLTLNHIPLDPDTVLEVNGKRCTMQSEGSSCCLRRNRVDKIFDEATFVSTDSIRLSGSVKFEVFDGEDLILSGALEISDEKENGFGEWRMSCESMICGKQMVVCDSMPPMIEVYVAGSCSGTPIILTKSLQISLRKKQSRSGILDSIPEYDLQMSGDRGYSYKPENENFESSLYLSQTEFMEGEDGALSWFNAGVRVGVGIGLCVCLGVGIGVGLLVRTYQSTTRNFRRRF